MGSACDVESQAPARSQVVAVAAAPTEKPKSCCSCWYLIIALVVFAICVVAYLVLGPKTEKKYVYCPKCNTAFTTQSALATHQQQCGVTPGPKTFACAEGCHKVFQSQSALTKHYQATAHKCSVCNEMIDFGAPKTCSLMVLHEANCRGPNAPEIEWQCPKCHLVFDTVNAGHVCRKVNTKPNRTNRPGRSKPNRIMCTTSRKCSRCGMRKCNGGCQSSGNRPNRVVHTLEERQNMANGLHPN